MDISNPSSPAFVGRYDTEGEARDVTVSGTYAYVSDKDNGIVIIDVSNPSSPTLVCNYGYISYVYGGVHSVSIRGNYAYVCAVPLVILDITNPSAPTVASVPVYPGDGARSVDVVGNYAYVVRGTSGLLIYQVNTNSSPVADAVEDYKANEGSPITFDASLSTDPDADALQYRWDFESDGTWDTEWSNNPVAIHTWDDDWSGSAKLEVSDGELTSTDSVTVTVSNTNPVVEAGQDQTVNEGDTVSFSGSYSDAGTADTHVASWDFGDGTTVSGTLNPSHVYTDNGVYTVTLTVTDDNGGVGIDTIKVTVNNVNPALGEIVSPIDPASVNTQLTTSCSFTDAGSSDTHTGIWSWGDGTNSPGFISEANGIGTVTGEHPYSKAGVYWVTLTVTDDDGGSASKVAENYIVIYNPEGGFVTGGGWTNSPAGAYVADKTMAGKATFGFVSKYQKGATVPTGMTEFQFKVANLNFHSENYEWLVVAGPQANYKGSGTINGEGNYGFILTAVDGAIKKDGIDKFRIKIWNKEKETNSIIYDNENVIQDDAEPSTVISGGSIVIHKK